MREDDPLRPETEATARIRDMRHGQAVRLLNSFGQERVISDAQLRRHCAEFMPQSRRRGRVDVAAYAAWLLKRSRMSETARMTGPVNLKALQEVLKRQDERCALTGRRLTPQTASMDHVVPLSRGGKNVVENVQIVHEAVNRAKGGLNNRDFIALCREVVAWADSRKTDHN
jgi:5-methylcytosine-specific restriction endonuclease McrA